MRRINVLWAEDDDSEETREIYKESLYENLGVIVERETEILEISLVHDIEYREDKVSLVKVSNVGITLPNIFIPLSNIACIKIVENE
ncbi:hypothetical protein G3N56_02080 [Desulfovibrio sulfodismutans]|uniref:Uncharacterized protein n=1 Tax=Desulfolutivibrio sulfodismutans TaxID=63561 RepID=A0A7K3NI87_9BACT|nr:hypothetical protein [Desulfolutivibrio sulfodismutans]NDY55533.1 hypothetical protein [Desulfolutivibrio sulfodismutans]QLA11436.1 hypothetical protein GD606_03670 [Desulfolutivibrio sulfodismutans DSM 3696]